jgi:transcriptional regulator with XRE-family HTH domain
VSRSPLETTHVRYACKIGFMHDALGTPEGLRALAERDVTAIYRLLNEAGVPQRDIATMTGQSQSDVSEILNGRTVMAYAVLVKIAEGLDIPRGFMGLAYNEDVLPAPIQGEEEDEEMKRRALLAIGSLVLLDRPVLGELLEPPKRPAIPTPLPTRLVRADVTALEALTAELRAWAHRWGGGAATISAIAQRSKRLLAVPASDYVRRALGSTIAKLHTVAGWAAFDEQLDDLANSHFAQAMSLGGLVKDSYWIAFALYGGGRIIAESGHPNDALKYYQLAQVAVADDNGRHTRAPILTGYLHSECALELAALEHNTVHNELAAAMDTKGRDADLDNITAETHMRMGNLDLAHLFATSAVNRWAGSTNRRHAVLSDLTLATINVQAGEPRGKLLAHNAIQSVASMRSGLARVRLERLATVLDFRSSAENKELAVMARRVAGQRSSK